MDAQPTVPRRQFGVVAAARAARLREDEDALQVIHEGGGLGEVGGGRAVLDDEAVALAHHAARASGHFGDEVRAEALDDLVERAGNGRQRSQPLDQLIAAGDGLAALDGLAVAEDGPRREVALAVGERLVELHREGMGEVVENILARRDVDADVVPFLGRNLGEPALHQRLAGRDDLDHGGMAVGQVLIDRADQGRRLHRGQQMAEEALLGALEGRAGGRLRLRGSACRSRR